MGIDIAEQTETFHVPFGSPNSESTPETSYVDVKAHPEWIPVLPSCLGACPRLAIVTLFLHDAAELKDLRVPPGNRLEALRGEQKGLHSIRINDQWRVVFRWEGGNAFNVQIMDYHK